MTRAGRTYAYTNVVTATYTNTHLYSITLPNGVEYLKNLYDNYVVRVSSWSMGSTLLRVRKSGSHLTAEIGVI